ncbi:MAG: ankyrin repeat domain-containing protein [Pseudomonadota bacterium]|nr:ankyrin repeat domain-containing protein [Pseudomonadota bacterium]
MRAIVVFVISWAAATSLLAKVPAPVASVLHRDDARGLALLLQHTALSISSVVDGYYGYTMLHLAAKYNKVKIMQWLIDNDADVGAIASYHKALPLATAAKHGSIEAMAMLLANHADLEARSMFDHTPLIQATKSKNYVAVNWLLANGADANANGEYGDALHQSLLNGTDKISERLLRAGANVHARYERNVTPLMLASERGNAKMVAALVDRGADVNAIESGRGSTPIILAVQGHLSLSEETGSKSVTFTDGTSIGELVPSDNYRQVIEILQNAGADINATDAHGNTALFHATADANVDMIRILATAGADFTLTNPEGEDVFAVAKQMFNPQTAQKILAVFAELGYGSISASTEDKTQGGTPPEYLENLTALAEDKNHNPIYGREREIELVSNALRRKSMRGVVLVGEPGVGKTAIVEAFAYMLAKDELPQLAGREIFKLDVGRMWGREENMYVGQLARHVDATLKFIVSEPDKRILFIDEIHQLLGGGHIGIHKSAPPITDLLKPYLGRGDIMLIGATTYDEYHDIIEGDRAIVERFLRIDIDAPSPEETLKILQDTKTSNEEHYGIAISAEALSAVVTLSDRYLTAQQQPRKAVNLLEEALVSLPDDAKQLTEQHIAAVIAEKLNIDVNTILKSTSEKLKGLLPALQKDIYGQDDILADIASKLSVALIGFSANTRPLACVLACRGDWCRQN